MFLTGYRQRGFYGKCYMPNQNISMEAIMERVRMVEHWEVDTVKDQLQRNSVQIIPGMGKFIDSHHIEYYSSNILMPILEWITTPHF